MNIGFDGGHYNVKCVTDGKRIAFPSFVCRRPPESMLSFSNHRTIIANSDGDWLIGDEAIRLNQAGTRKESGAWIGTHEYTVLLHAALSEATTATQVSINLVTGLPILDFRQSRERLAELLIGEHRFTRYGRDYSQVAKIKAVKVAPQAWGAVFVKLLDDRGKIVNPELVRERLAILDIGGRTVNYLSVDGLADVPTESKGTPRGTWNVVRAVRGYLEATCPGQARIRDHVLMQAILDGGLYNEGDWIDLKTVAAPIITDIGREIIDTAEQYWDGGAATFRRVLVIGGGAYLWGDMIRVAFRQAEILESPEFANARGFYRYAQYLDLEGQW